MSEFSDSYHVAADAEAAVRLIEAAGQGGWVVATNDHWTTFVIGDGFDGRVDDSVATANEHVLLYYFNAEDHACGFHLFDDAASLGSLRCSWNGGPATVTRDGFDDYQAMAVLARVVDYSDVIIAIAEMTSADGLPVFRDGELHNPGHRLAKRLRLPRYEWLSGAYALNDDESDEWVRVEPSATGERESLHWIDLAKSQGVSDVNAPALRPPFVQVPDQVCVESAREISDGLWQWSFLAVFDVHQTPSLLRDLDAQARAAGYDVEVIVSTSRRHISRWQGHGTTVEAKIETTGEMVGLSLTSPMAPPSS